MALTNFKNVDKKEADSSPQPKPCTTCYTLTKHEVLIKHGSLCEPCFNSYCRQAPAYMPELEKYKGDPRAWAKRIIDKHESGAKINQTTLKFAQEAVK